MTSVMLTPWDPMTTFLLVLSLVLMLVSVVDLSFCDRRAAPPAPPCPCPSSPQLTHAAPVPSSPPADPGPSVSMTVRRMEASPGTFITTSRPAPVSGFARPVLCSSAPVLARPSGLAQAHASALTKKLRQEAAYSTTIGPAVGRFVKVQLQAQAKPTAQTARFAKPKLTKAVLNTKKTS